MPKILNELNIEAKKQGFIDLDFPSCAESLRQHIDEHISSSISVIRLDLRWCIIIYSQAHIFLDSCLKLYSEQAKQIIILTTDNYITREMTCYEFFRTTIAVENTSHNPKSVTSSVEEYCKKNNLSIEIKVYSGDTDQETSSELISYFFPNKE